MLKALRLAVQSVRHRPGPATSAILALGLAVGLTTAAFSIAWGSLYGGLPTEGSGRLVRVQVTDESGAPSQVVLLRDYFSWSEQATSFEGLSAWYSLGTRISGNLDYPEQYTATYVTDDFFEILAERPVMGRSLLTGEAVDGPDRGAVISHRLWTVQFSGDPHILGREIEVWNTVFPIVGVMPEGFRFPLNHDVWLDMEALLEKVPATDHEQVPVQVLAKLKQGVSLAQAQAELQTVQRRSSDDGMSENRPTSVTVSSFAVGYNRQAERPIQMLLASALIVFLIACGNVANLHLSWAATRSKAVAIRHALGASRFRMVTPLLLESGLLAVLGSIVGLGIAALCIYVYNQLGGMVPSFWVDIGLHPEVLLFALITTVLAALAATLVPAVRTARLDPQRALQEGAQTSDRKAGKLTAGLLVSQIALSFALVFLTSLLARSTFHLEERAFTTDPDRLLSGNVSLVGSRFSTSELKLRLYDHLTDRLSQIPQTRSVALTTLLPMDGNPRYPLRMEAEPPAEAEPRSVSFAAVTPEYFEAIGLPIQRGRGFRASDDVDSPPVAVVSRSFVEKYLAGDDPIGRRFRFENEGLFGHSELQGDWREIVGVVPDPYPNAFDPEKGLDIAFTEGVYVPVAQRLPDVLRFVVDSDQPPGLVGESARGIVASLDPRLSVINFGTFSEKLSERTRTWRLLTTFLAVFGLAALLLSAVGLYGVVALSLSRRTRALGIRAALGARPIEMGRALLRPMVIEVACGLVLGAFLSLALSRLVRNLLTTVGPADPTTLILAVIIVVMTTLAASWRSFFRAMRLNPAKILRQE